MLRFLFWLAVLVLFVWFGATVQLGNHTLFGHIGRIWHSEETQDLVHGTEKAVKPAAEKLKRAVKAGVDEARRDP